MYPPYDEAMTKLETLEKQLAEAGERIAGRTADLVRAEEAVQAAAERDAEAILAGKKPAGTAKLTEARHKAERELREAEYAQEVLQVVVRRERAAAEPLKEEAVLYVLKLARPDHEQAAAEVVEALRRLSAACRKEREIRAAVLRECRTLSTLPAVSPYDPGEEGDWHAPLSMTVRRLRELKYPV